MDVTFKAARAAAEVATGYPIEPYGYEGPGGFIVIPKVPMWEARFNDTVTLVSKDTGEVATVPYDRSAMDAWPLVSQTGLRL